MGRDACRPHSTHGAPVGHRETLRDSGTRGTMRDTQGTVRGTRGPRGALWDPEGHPRDTRVTQRTLMDPTAPR